MKHTMMRQCIMIRWVENDRYLTQTTSWIPEKYAKEGNYVKLKDRDGEWVDGWQVSFVSVSRRSYDEVVDRGQDYKRTRLASDI
jgi:hypothetical protein